MDETISVSELTLAIKKQLETRFTSVSVKGEISNLKEQSSGHLYFTLKDADSQISAVLFKGNTKGLSRLPKSGDQVIVKGELSVYAPRGNYQIIVRGLQFAGVGELLLKLHELKIQLSQKGWFDAARKKPLPKFPKTIGVVTSPTGSVIQDILHILTRRFAGFHLILNPVKVQGEGAAAEIAQAIAQFNRHKLADVLIVGRGGGSLEDLWAFNEEIVAAAIFASEIPVISAVGHETDFCIADYVADVRAPTPSAAAEIAISEKEQCNKFLVQTHVRMRHAVHSLVKQNKHRLKGIQMQPFFSSSYALLGKYHQLRDTIADELNDGMQRKIDQKKFYLLALEKQLTALNPTAKVLALRQRFSVWNGAFYRSIAYQLQSKKQRLSQLAAHLKAIDPRNLLTKGYCILFSEKNDSVILSTKEIEPPENVRILIHDGELAATVNKVKL